MKVILNFILSIFFFCLAMVGIAQKNQVSQESIRSLELLLVNAHNSERHVLLDSLCDLIQNSISFGCEETVTETFRLAQDLDASTLYIKDKSNLIFYLTNRVYRPAEGLSAFLTVSENDKKDSDAGVLASLYANGGDSYLFSGKIEQSILEDERSQQYSLKAKDSLLYGAALNYEASAYSDLGSYAKASNIIRKAISIFTELNNNSGIVNA